MKVEFGEVSERGDVEYWAGAIENTIERGKQIQDQYSFLSMDSFHNRVKGPSTHKLFNDPSNTNNSFALLKSTNPPCIPFPAKFTLCKFAIVP